MSRTLRNVILAAGISIIAVHGCKRDFSSIETKHEDRSHAKQDAWPDFDRFNTVSDLETRTNGYDTRLPTVYQDQRGIYYTKETRDGETQVLLIPMDRLREIAGDDIKSWKPKTISFVKRTPAYTVEPTRVFFILYPDHGIALMMENGPDGSRFAGGAAPFEPPSLVKMGKQPKNSIINVDWTLSIATLLYVDRVIIADFGSQQGRGNPASGQNRRYGRHLRWEAFHIGCPPGDIGCQSRRKNECFHPCSRFRHYHWHACPEIPWRDDSHARESGKCHPLPVRWGPAQSV